MIHTVEEIEKVISKLPQDQLKQFRVWYEDFDSKSWDKQIERDASVGKFDTLAESAISDHKAGNTKQL